MYCEVGYAKAKGIPFFLTFHKRAGVTPAAVKSGTANKVHLDLAPSKYIEYDPLELRNLLKQALEAWHP